MLNGNGFQGSTGGLRFGMPHLGQGVVENDMRADCCKML